MKAMVVFALMLIFGLFSADLPFSSAQTIFNVLDYGAKADGKTDDSNAFSAAWKAACSAATQNPTVVVPRSKDFLVKGTINAPSSPSVWRGRNARRWLIFHGVTGLHITGNGTFNGHGSEWWDLIGSLGKYANSVKVENIHVKKVNFKGTTNGVRIKTWQIGLGYARNISFEHITLESVKNPIYIDQNYCDINGTRGNCESKSTGVHISEVTYDDIVGTSSSKEAINLNCSQSVACTGITLSNIKIESDKSGQQVISACANAHGTNSGVVQPKSCLQS
ncbi:polygalacturonase [Quercus suber]|uniref:Polygalacturonase n=1 Tax=Quercus suber TaxID=58331 RepID=A0AAW0LUH5_QUESU